MADEGHEADVFNETIEVLSTITQSLDASRRRFEATFPEMFPEAGNPESYGEAEGELTEGLAETDGALVEAALAQLRKLWRAEPTQNADSPGLQVVRAIEAANAQWIYDDIILLAFDDPGDEESAE
jgi:hypothetical protein